VGISGNGLGDVLTIDSMGTGIPTLALANVTANVAADGAILDAKIVPPTSQNQKMIEEDLRAVVERNLALDDPALTWKCEQAIRNYDPCISCATHFLRLTIERE
jgi:coenzyme F420-reducing hydrogenase alpha subunit